ncbi:ROK family transcriptional regulator [Agromyces sp. ZXT2-3]|uniref:ROK family transcriptional regulator n=1 Tax=Agromyces sp. ZXT2-3 TaxID=3461152 RepID=UPI004054F9ED
MARREATTSGPGSRALVVDLIRSAGPISRVELTEATGLTQPSISNIVRRLLDEGVIRETGTTVSTRGKPRSLLAINSRATFGIGMQFGAEGIVCVATDTRGGVFGRERVTDIDPSDADGVVARIATLYREFTRGLGLDESAIAGLAVVTPGPIDPATGAILGPPSLRGWHDFRLRDAIRRSVPVPVLVDNDAAASAVGEYWSRQISRDTTFAGLYMGTGIGAGMVFNGALFRGASSNTGELGHITVEPGGRACFCGNSGCLERYASPSAIVASARADPGVAVDLVLDGDDSRAFDELAMAAIRGHERAHALITESADRIASATLTFANLLDVEHIVLAGPGFAIAGSIYAAAIRESLSARAFARALHPITVELSANPRDSAAVGAAALVLQGSVTPGYGPGATGDGI